MALQRKQVEMLKVEKKELKATVEKLGTENKSLVDMVERLKLENQTLRNTNAIFAEELDALRVKIQCGPSNEQHKESFGTPQNLNSVDDPKSIKEPVNKSRIESLQTTSNSEDPRKLFDKLKLNSELRRGASNEAVRKSNNDIPRSVDAKKSSKTDPRSDSAALKTKIATRKFSQITPPNPKQLKMKPDESRQRRISAPLLPSSSAPSTGSGHTTLTRWNKVHHIWCSCSDEHFLKYTPVASLMIYVYRTYVHDQITVGEWAQRNEDYAAVDRC